MIPSVERFSEICNVSRLTGVRVPTSVGPFSRPKNPTKVGTLTPLSRGDIFFGLRAPAPLRRSFRLWFDTRSLRGQPHCYWNRIRVKCDRNETPYPPDRSDNFAHFYIFELYKRRTTDRSYQQSGGDNQSFAGQ